MKNQKLVLAILIIVTAFNLTMVQAKDAAPLFPLPFTPDFTRGSGWGAAVGLGVEYESAYAGSDEYAIEVDPAGAIQWRRGNHLFSWEGLEVSWTTRQREQWYIQVDLGLDGERVKEDSDKGRLNGLQERDDEFAATGELRYAFDEQWQNYIGTRISLGVSDLGTKLFLFAGHRFSSRQDGGGTEAFLYATFGDRNNLNREFGVSSNESASSGLEQIDLSAGHRSTGLRLVDRRFVSHHIQIVSGLEFDYYSNSIQDSSIAREDFSFEAELGVLYHF